MHNENSVFWRYRSIWKGQDRLKCCLWFTFVTILVKLAFSAIIDQNCRWYQPIRKGSWCSEVLTALYGHLPL